MAGFEDGKLAIRQKLVTGAAVLYPTLALEFPNEFLEPPATTWVFVDIQGLNEEIIAFGGGPGRNEWRIDGQVLLVVHFPLYSGLAVAGKIRDDLSGILRGQRFSGVSCYGATPFGGSSKAETGSFYTLTAVVDFNYRFVG